MVKPKHICGASKAGGKFCTRVALRAADGKLGRCKRCSTPFESQQGALKHGLYSKYIKNRALLDDFATARPGSVDDEIRLVKALAARALGQAETLGWDAFCVTVEQQMRSDKPCISRTWRGVVEEYMERISRLERVKAEIESKQEGLAGGDTMVTVRVVRPVGLED